MLIWLSQHLNSTVWGRLLPSTLRADLFRVAGDQARDSRDWSRAVREYEKYLLLKPKQVGLWIQLGNMRKEMGDLRGSRLAYNTAYDLTPDNSDLALQQGHLSKVEGKIEEAHSWYKRAFQLDSKNYHAAEELIALGEDTQSIRTLLSKSAQYHRGRPREDVVVVVDFTDLLTEVNCEAEVDRRTLWFAQLVEEIAKYQPGCLFCIRDYDRGSFAILPDEAVAWLMGRIGVRPSVGPADYKLPHGEICNSDLLIVLTSSTAQAKDFYRRLRKGKELTVVGIVSLENPPSVGAKFPFAFLLDEASSALLKQASLLFTPSACEADALRFASKQLGRAIEVATLVDEQRNYRKQNLAQESIGTALNFVYFPSYDVEQQHKVVAAWSKLAPLGATLQVVLDRPTDKEVELVSMVSHQYDNVGYVAPASSAFRRTLTAASCVLVGGLRNSSLLWIQDAIQAGTPIVSGLIPDVFRTWGGLVADYCDLSDPEKAVRRWLAAALLDRERKQYRIDPLPWANEAKRLVADAIEQTASGKIDAQRIETGVFYSFGAILPAESMRMGFHLLVGEGWSEETGSTALIVGRNASLQFCADDRLATALCIACPIASTAGAELVVSVTDRSGGTLAERTWKVPPSGKGWFTIEYPTNAKEGCDTPIVLNFELKPPSREAEMRHQVAVGGIFIFAKDLDRYWFEFLEGKADGLLPSLPRS